VWWSSDDAGDQGSPTIPTPLDDPNCYDSFATAKPEQLDPEVVICTVACNDPECPESACPEGLLECTEASCSPPPAGPGACHCNNTFCAGPIPTDVLNGAFSLQALRPASACHQLYAAQATDQFQHLYVASPGSFSCPINYDLFSCEPLNYENEYTCHPQLHPSSNSLRTLATTEDFTFSNSVHVYPDWNFTMPAEHEPQIPFPEPILTTETSSCSSFSPIQQISSSFSTGSTPCTASPYTSPLTNSTDPVSPQSHSLSILPTTESFSGSSTCIWEASEGVMCGLTFRDESELQTHVQSVHTACLRKSNGFYCMWRGCARRSTGKDGFAQRSKLDRHIQSHTGCSSSFSYLVPLCTNSTADKAETCPDCGQQCSTTQSLILHQRTHSGEKPHKCKEPGCNYAAAQASQLSMSLFLHSLAFS
jgi:hypothetical protein